jgi:Kef-type K+ transport system membrane component KefB
MIEAQFITFFIILFVAVLFSALFTRFKVPWAVALILGGIIIGPSALNLIETNEIIIFLAEVGAVFLMFMAGLETPVSSFKKSASKVSFLAFWNGLIPFGVGVGIGFLFGFTPLIILLLGIIFVSSSVAVVVPTLDKTKLLGSDLGHMIVGSTVIQDVTSLILISVFLQVADPITTLPLPVFYILLALLVIVLYRFITWIRKTFIVKGSFHQELQFIIVILTGVVALFSLLGLHHIIAGFFTGLVLSESLHNKKIKGSLHTIGYGVFIPVFFVLIGTNADLHALVENPTLIPLTLALIVGVIGSKYLSGYITARVEKFTHHESVLIGVTSIPQLATTLAVAYTAFTEGIISGDMVTALVILSVVTTLISPSITQYVIDRGDKKDRTKTKLDKKVEEVMLEKVEKN